MTSAPPHRRLRRRLAMTIAVAAGAMLTSALPAAAHASFPAYAGFALQPNPTGSVAAPYAPGTRTTLVVRAAVETTSPYAGSDDTNVRVTISVPTGWTDPMCGSALLQVNDATTVFTNQPGAPVGTWSCQVVTVGANRVIRFTGPQVVAPATRADSAQFFSFIVTTPTPSVKTSYSGADGTEGFIVDQTYASGANSHWYPNAAYQGSAPVGTTKNELATGLVRTVNPAPGAPTGAIATRGDRSATVSWTAPTNDGGSAITGYTVNALLDGALVADRTCTTTSTTCSVTNLANGRSYTFVVVATNAIGTSSPSSPTQLIAPRVATAVAPNRPTALALDSARGGALHIHWTPPSSNGGASITSYRATATSPTDATPRTCTVDFGSNACTITGVVIGAKYSVALVARNSVGASGATTLTNVTAIGAAGAPATVTASQTGRSAPVRVKWSAASANGSVLSGHVVSVLQGGTPVAGAGCSTTTAHTCLVSGLTPGATYVFTVVATNAEGSSSAATSPPFTTRS